MWATYSLCPILLFSLYDPLFPRFVEIQLISQIVRYLKGTMWPSPQVFIFLSPCVWEHLSSTLFNKYQADNTVLSAIVTMLFIRSSDLSHLITESLYPFTNPFLFPPIPSSWQPPFYSLFLRIQLFKIQHISDTIQYLFLFVWFISLSIMPSSFIHVVTKDRISFFLLRLNSIPLYIYHVLFIHSSIDGHLGWSIRWLLWIMLQ